MVENPPSTVRDGNFVLEGFNQELDEWRALSKNVDAYVANYEKEEKKKYSIDSLKVNYNKVHGFFIQISKAQALKAPSHYISKQTLKNY